MTSLETLLADLIINTALYLQKEKKSFQILYRLHPLLLAMRVLDQNNYPTFHQSIDSLKN